MDQEKTYVHKWWTARKIKKARRSNVINQYAVSPILQKEGKREGLKDITVISNNSTTSGPSAKQVK
jgi:hypothetical protein